MLNFLGTQLGMHPTSLSDALKETQKIRFKEDNHLLGFSLEILERKVSGKIIHYHKGGTPSFSSFPGFNPED
ncbi:MAG: hypothetical protein ACJATI_000856 [Halioglobus sp.]|jgi:hypothetical protein